jgi:hypothetical protein
MREDMTTPPSLFESFLSRHPISDELRHSLHAEVVLLGQAFCDRFKEQVEQQTKANQK